MKVSYLLFELWVFSKVLDCNSILNVIIISLLKLSMLYKSFLLDGELYNDKDTCLH
jgi:hypothetical protein